MKDLRKMMGAINTAVFAVLNFVFFVRPGSQTASWPGTDAKVGPSPVPNTGFYDQGFLYKTHEERGQKLQADLEDRRHRDQFWAGSRIN